MTIAMTSIRRGPTAAAAAAAPRAKSLSPKPRAAKSRAAKSSAPASKPDGIDPLRAQHLSLGKKHLDGPDGGRKVLADDSESPLGWLARRRGKDGRALIAPHQLLAGERLRADFTRAQLQPRTTSNWDMAVRCGTGAGHGLLPSDAAIAAHQRMRHALDAVGPEFSGLLLDVCCFLKGLEDVERERCWPRASAKIVLTLGLDRLARHYGYDAEATGKPRPAMRNWTAPAQDATKAAPG